MSRIRSLHPSLFTDEAYMELSMPARVILPGIWTECDDQGVFAWKPLTLKARLLPADAVDMNAIMFELARGNFIKKFTVDGRDYGAVRNFRKYQRPKKPTATHPLPNELRSYVGLPGSSGELVLHQSRTDDGPVEPEPATSGETSPQMEGEGDKMEGEGCRRESEDAPAREIDWNPGQPIPDEWKLAAQEARRKCSMPPINAELEAEKFTNRCVANSVRSDDWHRTWINWALNSMAVTAATPAAPVRAERTFKRDAAWDQNAKLEGFLRKEIGADKFEKWIEPSRPVVKAGRLVELVAPGRLHRDEIANRLQPQLEQLLDNEIALSLQGDDGMDPPAFLRRSDNLKVVAA